MDLGNEGPQNIPVPDQNGDTPVADMETLLSHLGPTPIAIEDLRPDELEGLRDFMTDFKFDWEEAASEKQADRQCRRKSSRRHTLCDVTPARRTRPLSGKVLSEDFSDVANFSISTLAGEDINMSRGHFPDTSKTILDIPCSLDSPQVSQEAGIPCHETVSEVGDSTTSAGVSSSSFLSPLEDSGKKKRNTRKKRRQSSALDRKRETLALLKTILSPNSCGVALTPPSELVRDTQDRGKSPVSSDVQPATATERKKCSKASAREKKKKTSRRKSRRLSGISGPMLELDTDGVPKLLKLEEVYGPQDGLDALNDVSSSQEQEKHTVLHGNSPEKTFNNSSSTLISSTLMETDEAACEGTPGVTDGQRVSLDYRVIGQSPLTPLNLPDQSSPRDSEYGTPRGLLVYQESPQTLCTPDKAVLGSFQQMQLHHGHAESSMIEANGDNQSPSEAAPASLTEGEVGENSHPDTEMRMWESPLMTPDTTPEEFITPELKLKDGEGGNLVMEEDNCIGSEDSNKENLSCFDSPSDDDDDDSFVATCDKKVRDLYLKKGQVGPKKGNTNLETVFEDPAKYDIALSRRKFKRLLAFPEKPWEVRKGTRGRKVERRAGKRRKYSLSRTAKKNDPVMQERLNFILKDIAEDSC